MKVYYAHCMHLYGTPQEHRDVLMLEALGFEVLNPNSPAIGAACAKVREDFNAGNEWLVATYTSAGDAVMREVFLPIVRSCDVFAFRALPDGRISAGVWQELQWAREFSRPVIELPCNLLDREMSVDATRAYLAEVGQR